MSKGNKTIRQRKNLPIDCVQGDQPLRCPNRDFLCAPASLRPFPLVVAFLWWLVALPWCVGGGDVRNHVMWCGEAWWDVEMWYVVTYGEMLWCGGKCWDVVPAMPSTTPWHMRHPVMWRSDWQRGKYIKWAQSLKWLINAWGQWIKWSYFFGGQFLTIGFFHFETSNSDQFLFRMIFMISINLTC